MEGGDAAQGQAVLGVSRKAHGPLGGGNVRGGLSVQMAGSLSLVSNSENTKHLYQKL